MSIHNGTAVEEKLPPLKLIPPPTESIPEADPQPAAKPGRRRLREGVRAVLTDDRTHATYRYIVRHGAYMTGGAGIVYRRAWDSRSTSRYERMQRTAEAAGNIEEAKEWEERGHRFREARHKRRMETLAAMRQTPKAVGAATVAGSSGLLLLGIALAWANGDIKDVIAPAEFVVELIRWAFFIGTVVWGPAKMALPALGLLALWRVGQQRQAAPAWALPAKQRVEGEAITPSIVVKAFRDLRIGELKKAILAMEDGAASMLSPIVTAGCGVEVDVTLPSSVSTDEIMGKRRKLAENLNRHEHEVYVSIAPAARTVRVWIADSGALDEPIGPSPLVTDTSLTADYKSGRAPWGVDLRGDAVLISLYQKMVLVTGLSNQGKTASLRALALWLAMDPTVEFRIGDLKGIGDWRMFDGLATTLIEGPTDDHVMDVTHMVEGVFDEMNRRLQQPEGTVFKPLVCIVDEAQVAYGSGAREEYIDDKGNVKYGAPYGGAKATSRYFRAVKGIHDQGRAVDVEIWEGTQDPTDQNLPKRSREGNHIRAALVLGTKSQAEMALGEAPVEKGAAPHKLRQGLDKGQLVAAGEGVPLPPGQVSLNVRTHYVSNDDAKEVADRAKALRRNVATLGRPAAVERRDELVDVRTVLVAEDRVRTTEVIHRLKNLAKSYYKDWDGARLRKVLTDAGEDTNTFQGYPHVTRERVLKALANRENDDPEAR
ncbi:cell division protein FtsK [Streptomyces durmitorensis]|uniref:ATP-binding protein n=1 Tax=Streptomyces durmitorensis TaxID=319947 RepID=A0ABY4PKR5_9ACTN|nr:ATP-binding protein [Streptomyces durmitorensis]UQT54377.1 ATP-binding protein [Streptomyces durmitorensis]